MKILKNTVTAIIKDRDYRKVFIGSCMCGVSLWLMLDGTEKWGRKIGAEKIIQTAEKMQPGFREALVAFVKENY